MLQALLLATCIGPVAAQQGEPQTPSAPSYSLATGAEQQIDNDRMTVSLMAYREGGNPAELAEQINELMREALTRLAGLSGFDALSTQTLGYRISPSYSDKGRKVDQWTASQALQLRTSDFVAGTEAIGALQDLLQIQDMAFDVLPATRRVATDALIVVALERFTARSELIARTMGSSSHQVVEVDVRTDGAIGYPQRPAAMYRTTSAAEAAPQVSAGTSTVSVTVSGRITLDRP